jgi:hypothetical protein
MLAEQKRLFASPAKGVPGQRACSQHILHKMQDGFFEMSLYLEMQTR